MSFSPPLDDPFGLVGRSLDGKYDVAAVVAEGGFGVVYRASHRALQKDVALKVLKVPTTLAAAARREFLEKFALEARTIARFEHPNIVRVIDFGASVMPGGESTPWMVLEWLEGSSLEAHLAALGASRASDPASALALLGPVFEAIAYAHDEGIAHRDLKPANVMLRRTPRGELSVKVLDFGIAKLMGADERTASGQTHTASALQAFSLHYAAPEQLTGMRTGPWTDVHALALLLVEVLTGRPPFTGNDTAELYASALAPQRPTPRARGIDVGAWEAVIARALAFKPAERFSDARAFLDALRATLPVATWLSLAGAVAAPQLVSLAPQSTTLRGAAVSTAPVAARGPVAAVGVVGAIVVVALLVGGVALSTRSNPSSRTPAQEAPTARPQVTTEHPVESPVHEHPAALSAAAADAAVVPLPAPSAPLTAVATPPPNPRIAGRRPNRTRPLAAEGVGAPTGTSASTAQLPVE